MTKELIIREHLAESNLYVKCNMCGRVLHILEFGVCSKGLLQSKATCLFCLRKLKVSKSELFTSFENNFSELVANHHEIIDSDIEILLFKINSYSILYSNHIIDYDSSYSTIQEGTTFIAAISKIVNSLDTMLSNRVSAVKECTEVRTTLHNQTATELGRVDLMHNPPCKHLSKSKVVSKEDDSIAEDLPQSELSWGLPVDKTTKYQNIQHTNNVSEENRIKIAKLAPGAKEETKAYIPSEEEDTIALLGGEQVIELAQEMYDTALVKKLKIAERSKLFSEYIKGFNIVLTIPQVQKMNRIIEQDLSISDVDLLDLIATIS